MPISVSGNIPGGRIEVVDCSNPADIRLRLIPDLGSEFRGHYNFRLSGGRGVDCLSASSTPATRSPRACPDARGGERLDQYRSRRVL